jgi:hypothetical protein
MKKIVLILSTVFTLAIAGVVSADSLELADGTVLEGDFVGSSNGIIMFDTGEGIEAFPESEVVGVFFSSGVETMQQAPNASVVTVPAGTRLVIRTTETIDTRQHSAGHRFRGQLEGAIVVDGVQAIPRGTFVHGRIAQARQSGRMAGSSRPDRRQLGRAHGRQGGCRRVDPDERIQHQRPPWHHPRGQPGGTCIDPDVGFFQLRSSRIRLRELRSARRGLWGILATGWNAAGRCS